MLGDLVPLLAIIFAVGLPLSIPIVMISLNYRKRRRLMELHHTERMAAIERGMEVPPLPLELIDGRSNRRRSSLLPGLVWFFVGLAIVAGSLSIGDDLGEDMPMVFGLVPLAIGIAYLIYYAVEGRHVEARQYEMDMRERNSRLSQGPATL
jgi:uncharacterized protein DUF6249